MQHPRSKTTWIRSIATAVLLLCAALVLRLNTIPAEVLNVPVYPYAVFGALLAVYAALFCKEDAKPLSLAGLPALAYLLLLCFAFGQRIELPVIDHPLAFSLQHTQASLEWIKSYPVRPMVGTFGWMLAGFLLAGALLDLPRFLREGKPIAWRPLLWQAALWLGIAVAVTVFESARMYLAYGTTPDYLHIPPDSAEFVAATNAYSVSLDLGYRYLPMLPGILLGLLLPLRQQPKKLALPLLLICILLWLTTTGQSIMGANAVVWYTTPGERPLQIPGLRSDCLDRSAPFYDMLIEPALGNYVTALGVLFGHAVQSLRAERKASKTDGRAKAQTKPVGAE